jgi:hypothetical protein
LLRLAVAQLRFRPGRSVVLLVVLMATVACFALVGASARTEQVTVHGTLEADSRAAYDLLVRPAGSVSARRSGEIVTATGFAPHLAGVNKTYRPGNAEIIDLLLALNAEHGTPAANRA